jgi:hypothetical protein
MLLQISNKEKRTWSNDEQVKHWPWSVLNDNLFFPSTRLSDIARN